MIRRHKLDEDDADQFVDNLLLSVKDQIDNVNAIPKDIR